MGTAKIMFRPMLAAAALLMLPTAPALSETGAAQAEPDYRPVEGGLTVAGRNFYLLSLLSALPEPRDAVARDPALTALAAERSQRLSTAADCQPKPACTVSAWRWTAADIATVGAALARLPDEARRPLAGHLRRSGMVARHAALEDAALIERAWAETAAGINHILDVYGLGQPPRYPAIDAISFDVTKPDFAAFIASAHATVIAVTPVDAPLFVLPRDFALTLLYLNEREDAAAHEPLDRENEAAIGRIARTDWRRYRYSALLVLGDGPEMPEARLGALGKLRLMAAAARWRQGLAPVIIVSGGSVHPAHTRFNEAIEMRRELIERHGIPADAIIIEPHARHTTTNLRNAARLMFRYRIPFDHDALIVTSEGQSQYVEGPVFRTRCLEELGYMPASIGARVSAFDLVFRPLAISLSRDPLDPLDP
ncbi:YdcF family protein [Sphingomonas mucosissima]|uniref:DUF218 domain-containing protein n=1 Tax=Sphingomonas mucosissima TaxID=370959 RepID=A0A245ZQG6_9SPHN|nr:YdcF family protein [Sphingomonas mucosissima]OWK31992.1 hypothetical protein SPMU_03130 [Sphingomonas mucosissima]